MSGSGGFTVEEIGLACYFAAFHECVSELPDVDLDNVLVGIHGGN